MLQIEIKGREFFNEKTLEFINLKDCKLQLEHSLVSLSKWESKWHKPFLSQEHKTREETIDYVKCMTLTQNVDPLIYQSLSSANIKDINKYIEDPMTATTINNRKNKPHSREIITSEIIYYWMIQSGIPMECQKWHLNRLLTLIEVCSIKGQKGEKMSNKEILSSNAALNAARRKKFNTKG